MRYILKFNLTQEQELEGFIPMIGDQLVIEHKGKSITLRIVNRRFLVPFKICILFSEKL